MFKQTLKLINKSNFISMNFATKRPVEVISRKVVKDIGHVPTVEYYMSELTIKAQDAPGYISSCHKWKYRELDERNNDTSWTLCTRSEWSDIESWNKWVVSKERNEIHSNKDYQRVFSTIDHEVYSSKIDTPCLV